MYDYDYYEEKTSGMSFIWGNFVQVLDGTGLGNTRRRPVVTSICNP